MQAQGNVIAIQAMGMLMSRQNLQIQLVLQLVQTANNSYFECQRIITILEDIFQKQRSAKILLAVEILEYLVKNCNKNLHQAANKASFQLNLMGLLKRLRGKTSFLKNMRSNSQNWSRIQAKILYLLQLWYDAFILEQNVYDKIIASYKQLRKQGVLFPPRTPNEKSLLFIKTQSPIFQNIEDIARQDMQKFSKKVQGLGFKKVTQKLQLINEDRKLVRKIDLNQLSQNIAIVRSNGYEGSAMIKLIENIRKDLEVGKVESSQQQYWKDIKEAAESVISEWQQKNSQFIQRHERQFLQSKMGKMQRSMSQPDKVEYGEEEVKKEQNRQVAQDKIIKEEVDDLLGDVWGQAKTQKNVKLQIDLLDM